MRRPLGHRRARGLVAALLDGGLSEAEARAVRRHAARCRRCARHLRELEASERLVRRLPARLVAAGERGEGRLAALARWSPAPRPARPATGLPAAGALAAALALAVLLAASGLPPRAHHRPPPSAVAAVLPESSFLPNGIH